ncbi:hypothetical protein [Nocardia abscessus]|uniref:hypothetical protein n=1 Tax=Nocardia abscessus TaxID=120957 RepID=UPI00245490C9|nr:hypothetical protein [Nocardia abscessus]
MPQRSNLFQKVMAIVHEHISGEGATVTESKFLPDGFTGQLREVDICIERDQPGSDRFIIGIECRDHPRRKQTIEWVEQMFGKHHLLTHKLILISSSGFTGPALAKAEALKIHTITPGSDEGLRDDLIGQLKVLWAKTFRLVPEAFKCVLENTDGSLVEFQTGIGGPGAPNVFNADGELIATGNDFIGFIIQSVPPDNAEYRDAENGRRTFLIEADPSSLTNSATGERMNLYVRESERNVLLRIVGVELSGTIHIRSVEMPLSHSRFGDVAYSYGSASLGGDEVMVVSTQLPNAEPRRDIRVVWGESRTEDGGAPDDRATEARIEGTQ